MKEKYLSSKMNEEGNEYRKSASSDSCNDCENEEMKEEDINVAVTTWLGSAVKWLCNEI